MESLESRFPARGTALIMGTKFFVHRYRKFAYDSQGDPYGHLDTYTEKLENLLFLNCRQMIISSQVFFVLFFLFGLPEVLDR